MSVFGPSLAASLHVLICFAHGVFCVYISCHIYPIIQRVIARPPQIKEESASPGKVHVSMVMDSEYKTKIEQIEWQANGINTGHLQSDGLRFRNAKHSIMKGSQYTHSNHDNEI